MFSTSRSKLYPVRLRFSLLRFVQELYYEQSNHLEEFGRASVLNNKQEKVDALKRSIPASFIDWRFKNITCCFVLVFWFWFFIDFVKKFDEKLSLIRSLKLCVWVIDRFLARISLYYWGAMIWTNFNAHYGSQLAMWRIDARFDDDAPVDVINFQQWVLEFS